MNKKSASINNHIEILCKKSFLLFSQRRILSLLLLVTLYPSGALGRIDLL